MSSPDAINLLVQQALFNSAKTENRITAKPSSGTEKDQLMEVCRDFEEVMLNEILREAKIERAMVSEGTASQFYGEMIRETLAKSLADDGGMGLAETLYRQLSKDPQIVSEEHQVNINSEKIKGQE